MSLAQAAEQTPTYSYDAWLAECLTARSTAATYRNGVASFLHSVYGSDEKPEALAPRYISEIRTGQRSYFGT
jgi:hypothetical protein